MKLLVWGISGLVALAAVLALYWASQGRLGDQLRKVSAWLAAHKTASPEPSSFTDTDAMARQLRESAQGRQPAPGAAPKRDGG